jgi:sterol desaturase/sphingolipid hydroxylase (fatty acid hydroxylase superfamily)
VYLIDYGTKNKPFIKKNNPKPITEDSSVEYNNLESHLNVFQITIMETIQIHLTHPYLVVNNNYLFDLATFIPISFLYEIIFDFFHYWVHRIFHTNQYLYQHIHKKHHKNYHLTTIMTFYQSPLDFILAVLFPEVLSFVILQSIFFKFSLFQYILILNYKLFSEITGHCGKHTNSCGFVQCIWLPKTFNIEIVTEDHDLHHTLPMCNYSKRFVIWDKLFNTYVKHEE